MSNTKNIFGDLLSARGLLKKIKIKAFGLFLLSLFFEVRKNQKNNSFFQQKIQSKFQGKTQSDPAIIRRVSRLMKLPKNECPAITMITDKNKFRDHPFFKKARNKDRLLVYALSKKIILYRPITNEIIETIPISTKEDYF